MMIRRCCSDNPIVVELKGEHVETPPSLHYHSRLTHIQTKSLFHFTHFLYTSTSHLFIQHWSISHLNSLSYTHSYIPLMTSSIKNYDFYRKAVDGLQTKSVYGGISTYHIYSLSFIVSILSAIIISILTFSQLKSFIYPNTYSQLTIQDTMDQPLPTHIDILFNQLSCDCKHFHTLIHPQLLIFTSIISNPILLLISLYHSHSFLQHQIDKTQQGNGCHFVADFNLFPVLHSFIHFIHREKATSTSRYLDLIWSLEL